MKTTSNLSKLIALDFFLPGSQVLESKHADLIDEPSTASFQPSDNLQEE